MTQAMESLCETLVSVSKPVFVAIDGPCVGFGVALCCLSDVVVATERAYFSTPYTQLGQVPEGGLSATLAKTVGKSIANDMLLAGRRLTAAEALRSGLVSRVLWPTEYMRELTARLDVIGCQQSSSLQASKLLIKSSDDSSANAIMDAVRGEIQWLEMFWPSSDFRKSVRNFVENNNFP